MTKEEFWKCYQNDDYDSIVKYIHMYQSDDPWKWYDSIVLSLGLMIWTDEDEFQRNLQMKTILMLYIFNVDPEKLYEEED